MSTLDSDTIRTAATHLLIAADIIDRSKNAGTDDACEYQPPVEWKDADHSRARAIVQAEAKAAGITVAVMLGNRRLRHIVNARANAAARLRKEMNLSYPAIGQALGGRHHTTVMSLLGIVDREAKYARHLERAREREAA